MCKKKRWVFEPLLYRIRPRWTIDPPFFILYVYVMEYLMIFIICIFGCKKKRWVYEPLLYRIKGRWTIDPPFFILYVYVMNLFQLIWFFEICIFGCKKKRWVYEPLLYRIKGRWTIDPPFSLINIWWWIYFCSNEFWWYLCIIYLKFSPSFGRGAGLRRRCGLRGCIGCFGWSVKWRFL